MGKPTIKQQMEQHKETCPKCDREMQRVENTYKCLSCGFMKHKRGTSQDHGVDGRLYDKQRGLYL